MIQTKIKNVIKKYPFVFSLLKTIRACISPRYRQGILINNWVVKNINFVNKLHLTTFIFTEKSAFVEIDGGVQFQYVPNLNGGILGLEFNKKWEELELNLIVSNIESGQTFFDIGSSFGWFSINVASKIDKVKIYAFEPVSETFNMLLTNVRKNNLEDKIVVNKSAIANFCGEITITSDFHTGNYIFIQELDRDIRTEKVNAITIDQYIQDNNISQLDFIKCDIEGAEFSMLQGAENSLKRFHPHMLLEISEIWANRFNYNSSEIFNFLKSLGYRYYCIAREGKLFSPSGNLQCDLNESRNFFFYHKKKSVQI